VFENHCSTSNTTPASYNVTALANIKPNKHQRLADPLLQSGVVTIMFINTKKAFKKLYIFILRRFGLILIHLQSKK